MNEAWRRSGRPPEVAEEEPGPWPDDLSPGWRHRMPTALEQAIAAGRATS